MGGVRGHWCSINNLLVFLANDVRCRAVFRSFLTWLERVAVRGGAWERSSIDALLHAPMLVGPSRARRVDPQLADVVAQAAGEGNLARTGLRALAVAARFRGLSLRTAQLAVGNVKVEKRVIAYSQAQKRTFQATRTPMIHVALDGTRMGGRDMFYSVIWSGALGMASWAPPQALGCESTILFLRFCSADFACFAKNMFADSCRFLPILADSCRCVPIRENKIDDSSRHVQILADSVK